MLPYLPCEYSIQLNDLALGSRIGLPLPYSWVVSRYVQRRSR